MFKFCKIYNYLFKTKKMNTGIIENLGKSTGTIFKNQMNVNKSVYLENPKYIKEAHP